MTAKKRFSFLEIGNKKDRKRKKATKDRKVDKTKKNRLKEVSTAEVKQDKKETQKHKAQKSQLSEKAAEKQKAKLWLQQRKEMKKLKAMNKESKDPTTKIMLGLMMIGGVAFLVWGYWKYELNRDYSGDGFTHFIYIIGSLIASYYWYSIAGEDGE